MAKIETLITTMNLDSSTSLLQKMNVRGSYIIGNQCDKNEILNETYGKVVSSTLRGVGKNRNGIIDRATADICVLADDDMVFCDDYEEIAEKAFEKNPKADVIIFNFIKKSEGRKEIKKTKKIGFFNYMNYGAARMAFRRKSVLYHGITFNNMFGGGTPHGSGEDSLFLRNCLKAGLKVLAVPDSLAYLTEERESTWFKGYNDKYFYDKGAFFALAHPKIGKLLLFLLILKHKEERKNKKFFNCLKNAYNGFNFIKRGEFKQE
ncbi:MAG: glycosyltransferase family 2 protein [Clostridia bacterium]|nr:glycosyltransferase family 2 protein [Clostridia bacterium]